MRGVKNQIDLPLQEKSVLFYGDNGTGKSSIADAIEWFYKDKVSHLSGEEIDSSVLRNFGLPETDAASISVNYSARNFDSDKQLFFKRGKITSSFSNATPEFKEYFVKSEKENLILRYRNLEDFIKGTKGDKLKYLSEIIGYGEVTKVKEVIKKSFNAIKTEIKSRGFESQIQTQGAILIDKLGATIYTEKQLFDKLNEIILPLNTGITIASIADIETVIEKIKNPVDNKIVSELAFLQKCNDTLNLLKGEIKTIDTEYVSFYSEFEKIFNDIESIKQTLLSEVLTAGKNIISNKNYTQDNCPLCLEPKKQETLLAEIEARIEEIKESSEKLNALTKSKELFKATIDERIRRIDTLLHEPHIKDKQHEPIKAIVDSVRLKLTSYLTEVNVKVLAGNMIKKSVDLALVDSDFNCDPNIDAQIAELNKKIPKDSNSDVRVKIEFAKTAFVGIQKLQADKKILEDQKTSLELIYNEFVKRQKEGLESFLQSFSSVINEYYQFMNPGEAFEDLKIIPIEEEDELKGITIQFKFAGQLITPPQKFFSESHINCYGISFFLASVKAFNSINKFIVLDDVISSFDSNHRKRFADLLFDKFGDYQVILLTHETEWFSYVKELAKRKNWHIHEIKWTESQGTHLEESPSDLKELIEHQIANSTEAQLGNSIRRYLEQILKVIALNIEVKTNFRFNDQNEKRMPDELLNELKSLIGKKSTELKAQTPIIDRVATSAILGNLLSHDNPIHPKMGDLKAFWSDIVTFEKLFFCEETGCLKPISVKYFDNVGNRIRCGCGKLSYDWKK